MRRHPRPLPYFLCLLALAVAGLSLAIRSRAQTKNAPAPASQTSPSTQAAPSPGAQAASTPNPYLMDGEAGPCSVEFNVRDASGKPVASALISVHLAYGFGGFHKLDMSVYTDPEGHAKFIGIPTKVKNPPLQFRATKDQLTGVGTMNPASECQAKHDILMDVPKAK